MEQGGGKKQVNEEPSFQYSGPNVYLSQENILFLEELFHSLREK